MTDEITTLTTEEDENNSSGGSSDIETEEQTEQEEQETVEGTEEVEEEELCECEQIGNMEEPDDDFSSFEKEILEILKLKAPEFSDKYTKKSENINALRLTLKEAINQIDSDLFIIRIRFCTKNHKIPIYDELELKTCYAYYVASEYKIAECAVIQPTGGANKRLKAGSLEIAPNTTTTLDLDDNIYKQRFTKIIERRKKIRRQLFMAKINNNTHCRRTYPCIRKIK